MPPSEPKEEDVLDANDPAAHAELRKNGRTAFSISADAMEGMCGIQVTDFRLPIKSHEMDRGDSRFET